MSQYRLWTLILFLILSLPLGRCVEKKESKNKKNNKQESQIKKKDSKKENRRRKKGKKGKRKGRKKIDLAKLPEPIVPVLVHQLKRDSISSYYMTYVVLQADKKVEIFSRTTGIVEKLLVKEGEWVKAGQLLLRLEDDKIRAEERVKKLLYERAQSEFLNQKSLWEKKLTSKDQVDKAELSVEEAKLRWLVAEQELQKTQIRSPIEGLVAKKEVESFALLQSGRLIFSILDPRKLKGEVSIPVEVVSRMKVHDPVQIKVNKSEDQFFEGHINYISPIIDAKSGTVKVALSLDNEKANLKPGRFVQIKLTKGKKESVVVLPRTSISFVGGKQYFYKAVSLEQKEQEELLKRLQSEWDKRHKPKKEDKKATKKVVDQPPPPRPTELDTNIYKAQRVKLVEGIKNEMLVELLQDAKPGELILTEGFDGLKDQAKIRVMNLTELK